MIIIPRNKLKSWMLGEFLDPDQSFQRVFGMMADTILADAPPEATHFVYTDHENGDDATVRGWDSEDYEGALLKGPHKYILPMTDDETGYFGVTVTWSPNFDRSDFRKLYHCYLGGSPLNSAPGFVICTAALAD